MPARHIGTVIAVVTFLGGLLAWYRSSVETSIVMRRDWEHVKKNQLQMALNVELLFKESDARLDRIEAQLIEIKSMFYASLSRRGDSKP